MGCLKPVAAGRRLSHRRLQSLDLSLEHDDGGGAQPLFCLRVLRRLRRWPCVVALLRGRRPNDRLSVAPRGVGLLSRFACLRKVLVRVAAEGGDFDDAIRARGGLRDCRLERLDLGAQPRDLARRARVDGGLLHLLRLAQQRLLQLDRSGEQAHLLLRRGQLFIKEHLLLSLQDRVFRLCNVQLRLRPRLLSFYAAAHPQLRLESSCAVEPVRLHEADARLLLLHECFALLARLGRSVSLRLHLSQLVLRSLVPVLDLLEVARLGDHGVIAREPGAIVRHLATRRRSDRGRAAPTTAQRATSDQKRERRTLDGVRTFTRKIQVKSSQVSTYDVSPLDGTPPSSSPTPFHHCWPPEHIRKIR